MNRQEKAQQVEELTEIFNSVEGVILADASGVDVNSINELRSDFRADGVTFRVVKNTLAKRALVGTDKELLSDSFRGPTAIAVKAGDPVTPAKIAVDFAKKNKAFEIKGGLLSEELLDVDGVIRVSKMKGREELLADLLSIFKAPQREFVGICNTMVTQFVSVLAARARDLEEAA